MGDLLVFTVIGLLPLSMGLANFSLRASAVAAVMAPVMIVAGLYCDEMGVAVWVVSWGMSIAAVFLRDRERLAETSKGSRTRSPRQGLFVGADTSRLPT
jgi:hypothetical protein